MLLFVVSALLIALLFWQYTQTNKSEDAKAPAFQKIRERFKTVADEGLIDLHPVALRYENFIRGVLQNKRKRRRTMIALIIFALFAYSLVPLGYVVNEFFPSDDQEMVYAALTLPKGTGLAESKEEAQRFIEELRTLPDVRFVMAETNAGAPNDSELTGSPNANDLLFTILLTHKEEREISSGDFVKNLNNKYQDLHPHGDFSASQLSGGPPAGSDLQIKLLGEDPQVLQSYAHKIEDYLKTQNGVSQVKSSLQTSSGKIIFVPDKQRITEIGVSESTLAYWVRALGSGIILVDDGRFGSEKRDVVFRLTEDEFASPEAAATLLVPTNEGKKPLAELGHFELVDNPTQINREDNKQTLSVSAAVSDEFSVSVINKSLENFAGTLDLPQGYSWKTGGVNEENDKSIQSILKAMLLSAVLIFATMTIQFRSFRKSVIVLLVIPMAVSGVFIIFALTGTPLSFPALIGILALFGIVVNNSIIMVDKINKNMDAGMPLVSAVSEGAASRLEPILLTALATIVGLIPITLSDPIWQGLGGAIIAGLLFSGIAKLFMIPVLYFLFYGKKSDEEVNLPYGEEGHRA
jgi:HAE1 family hydrophobic/amphiphilic exporter-1